MKPLWTVCLIAKNESKTLPRLVKSLADYTKRGGEIILVDTGSTDNTAQIARELGCSVYEVGDKFKTIVSKKIASDINKHFVVDDSPVINGGDAIFDFASARNYAAALADTDMIAMPDCDEVYTKLDIDVINSFIQNNTQQFEYEFVFAHDSNGNPTLQFKHSKFYNRITFKRKGIIHEVLHGQAERMYLSEDIIKLEHYQNVETNRSGYLKGLAYDCYLDPSNDRNSHYFAREMMYTGRYNSAIQEFLRHIAMNKRQVERAQSMLYIGNCYKYLGDEDSAKHRYIKSRETEPNRREPLISLAQLYFAKKKYQQVVTYCLGALEIQKPTNFYSNLMANYRDVPHELLYIAYWWIGEKEKSKYHYDKAVEYNPTKQKYIDDRKFYY